MKSLFKIQQEYLELIDKIIEQEGVLDEETEQQLTINHSQLSAKVVAYDHIIKQLEMHSKMADEEIKRIEKFKQVKEKAIEKMKASLLQAVLLYGGKDPKKDIWRLEVDTVRLSTRQSKSTQIDDLNAIDEKFKSYDLKGLSKQQIDVALRAIEGLPIGGIPKIDSSVSKTELKKAIEDDPDRVESDAAVTSGKVDGAHIEVRYSLVIK